ncbi:hypothetical protein [Acanthopleuribacter pedis]|uniref:Uncharacterized protein n=1 Tax=Acanthopleuribacter pedis TaxID=442870 RepID=A0A8J7QCP5_9BACT|nr:hypothetical protein [Acanthopleuribacter pedis]MBO1317274.1 hypothetical protein [Acanthopleuribacter pedis]MBO1318581.1 hypothetical protein [Acanthopleuribacter pedis]
MKIKTTIMLAALVGGLLFAGDPPAAEQNGTIHVEGVWTIQIMNPDGSEASTRTFHNALVGASVLTALLNAEAVIGGSYLVLDDNAGNGPCSGSCEIGSSSLNAGLTYDSTNLVRSITGQNFETLVLSGSVTATSTHTVSSVVSWFCLCNGTTNNTTQCAASPDSCSVLTRKTLASPINVTTGQIIQVTLEITFSS